jgi:Tol biopolymer transport system component
VITARRSTIAVWLFVFAYACYSIGSLALSLLLAEGWDGLAILALVPPYYAAVGITFLVVWLLFRRTSVVAYSRWLLYPLLVLQAVDLTLRALAPALEIASSSWLNIVYLVLLPVFMLAVALSRTPSGDATRSTGWRPFAVDGLVVAGLVSLVLLAQEAAPPLRAWRQAAICAEGLATSTNRPPDVCRAPTLFVVRPDGTDLTQVTTRAFSMMPAWSPDGQQLVFVDSRSLIRVDPNGQNERVVVTMLGPVSDPSWSPDGLQILFMHHESADGNDPTAPTAIYVVPSDGQEGPRRLAQGSFARWSPDGSHILFRAEDTIDGRLCLQELDTARIDCLATPSGLLLHPSWSPDGQQILFALEGAESEVYTIRADGSQLVQRTSGGGRNPHWSYDGSAILFETAGTNPGEGTLCVHVLTAAEEQCIARYPYGEAESSWSPDGAEVVYLAMESEATTVYGLYRMGSDGSGKTRLAWNSMVRHPVWSPDGRLIAFQG